MLIKRITAAFITALMLLSFKAERFGRLVDLRCYRCRGNSRCGNSRYRYKKEKINKSKDLRRYDSSEIFLLKVLSFVQLVDSAKRDLLGCFGIGRLGDYAEPSRCARINVCAPFAEIKACTTGAEAAFLPQS